MNSTFVVGIDVGGQTSKLGVVDARGTVLAQTVIRTDTYTDIEPYIAELAEAVKRIIKEAGVEGKVRGIGVGAPNANYYDGTIENAVNLSWGGTKSIPFAKLLSEAMEGLPVSLTNDANAAAVGEMTYGAARGMKNFIMITLGTGVGSGIVINGDVVYGHDGFAGELGHVHATAVRQDVLRLMLLLSVWLRLHVSGLSSAMSLHSSVALITSLQRMFMRLLRKVTSLLSRCLISLERCLAVHLQTSSHSALQRQSYFSEVLQELRNSSFLQWKRR